MTATGSGSTIRINRRRNTPTFTFEGNRAIIFDEGERVPVRELAVCVATALTYHHKAARSRVRTRRA